MDFSAIKDRLLDHRYHAEQKIQYIKEHKHMNAEELHEYLYDYVLYKYNLFGDAVDTCSLNELAEISVAKALKLSKEKAIAFDNKGTCDGATSAMNKKVLLLMAVQRELGIRFPPERTAAVTSTRLLASLVWELMNK